MRLAGRNVLLRFVVIWAVLLGLYLLLSGDLGRSEWIAGCVIASLATLLVGRLQAIAQRRFGLPPGAWRTLGASFAGVLPETARVGRVLLRVLLRRPHGEVGTVEVERFPVPGEANRDAARRALETLGQSLSPNGFALSVGDGSVRLHRLAGR